MDAYERLPDFQTWDACVTAAIERYAFRES
jgi:hypothetical protein